MNRFAGGAVAGVVVGAAALVGLSLVGSQEPVPERIGVVEEIPAALASPDEPSEVVAEALPEEPAVTEGDARVASPGESGSEARETVPEAPASVAEARPPEEPAPAPEAPKPKPAVTVDVDVPPQVAEVTTPRLESEPEAPAGIVAAAEPEAAQLPASPGDASASGGEPAASAETVLPAAPVLPKAEALSPEEALDVVAPEGTALVEPDEVMPVEPEEPAPVEPESEVASSATALPDEPAASTLPGRVWVVGSALPGRDAVRVNRPGTEAPAVEPVPAAESAGPAEESALRRFAADWEPPAEAKPRLALVLLDDGATDPQAVAALPWPVSVALDPLAPQAAERLAAYRAAGVEALVLARLPQSAQPVDVAGILGDSLALLPETVAVLDLGEGGLAGRDATAQMAMSVAGREGRGVVLGDDKLGAGLALAAREGVPAAELLRDLDGHGEDEAAIGRGLDDAVRRVGQEGRGIVLARVQAGTLAALAVWSREGRADDVTVAPVSGVIGTE